MAYSDSPQKGRQQKLSSQQRGLVRAFWPMFRNFQPMRHQTTDSLHWRESTILAINQIVPGWCALPSLRPVSSDYLDVHIIKHRIWIRSASSVFDPTGYVFCVLPHRPSLPLWKSCIACLSSASVFMTNGPRAAMGSSRGAPASSNTFVSGSRPCSSSLVPALFMTAIPWGPMVRLARSPSFSDPTATFPLRTKSTRLCPSAMSNVYPAPGVLSWMSHRSTGVNVWAGPFCPL
mmetsp:Transcript_91459/g.158557  ORF Transcript_91459/g.158557 Transcript_91459/m.158557 type:complete len:233 (+) Transcript_91459:68-766(+)